MHLKTDAQGANAHFASVPTISRSRNAFSIAEKHVSTMQFDTLYPMYWKYIYPGDTLSITQKSLARLQTQIAPLYDDLYIDAHAWYVPFRLLQTNWARFQFNAQPDGPSEDNSSLTTPGIDFGDYSSPAGQIPSKSLYDYLGYPTKVDLSSMPGWANNYLARAYALIWNQNYRDENLQNPAQFDLGDGPDDPTQYVLLPRGKRHDKFTSSLPFQQKGAAVSIPLGSSAPVVGDGNPIGLVSTTSGTPTAYGTLGAITAVAGVNPVGYTPNAGGSFANNQPFYFDSSGTWDTGLQTLLSAADAATINQLRQSFAVQHILEADARGGTRDVESILNRWGVTVPDFRLQRPEYIGGTTWAFDPVIVPQTSETATTPQANLTQFSQCMNSFSISHSFVEHGVFMILFAARSNITYQQGLARELSYKTRFDFYQPEFANLGEVAVLNQEIYTQGTSDDIETFGFQEYAYELRYSENHVTGEMRSNYVTPLDSRHMADDYTSLPTLSSGWIESNTPISRNIVVDSSVADPLQFNMFVSGKIARTLPMYSIPGLQRL